MHTHTRTRAIERCTQLQYVAACDCQVQLARRSSVVDDKLEDEMAGLQVAHTYILFMNHSDV